MNLFNLLVLAAFFLCITDSFSQHVNITEANENPDGVSRTGLYTDIELDAKNIEKAWERHLKTFGKVVYNKGYYQLSNANVYDVSSKPVTVYSIVKSTIKGTHIWWAIDLGDSYASSSSNNSAFERAKKLLHDFAAECYRNDVSAQIKDAEKAVAAAERNHEKEIRHGEQLQRNIERNQNEKIKLEEQLKRNAEELEQLKNDVEANKVSQVAALKDIDKMKRASEVVKEKMLLIQ